MECMEGEGQTWGERVVEKPGRRKISGWSGAAAQVVSPAPDIASLFRGQGRLCMWLCAWQSAGLLEGRMDN